MHGSDGTADALREVEVALAKLRLRIQGVDSPPAAPADLSMQREGGHWSDDTPTTLQVNLGPSFGLMVGARVKELRGKLYQSEFADFLGVARNTVSLWEVKGRLPDAATIAQLCLAADCDPGWLLLGKPPAPSERQIADLTGRVRAELARRAGDTRLPTPAEEGDAA